MRDVTIKQIDAVPLLYFNLEVSNSTLILCQVSTQTAEIQPPY